MDLKEYVKNATRTESLVEEVALENDYLPEYLDDYILAGNALDAIKKKVFYGKVEEGFTISANPRLFHGLIGILTEASELSEILRRYVLEDTLDQTNLSEELGDLLWFIAIIVDTLGLDFDSIFHNNIAKLQARFPDKFDSEKALNRDIENERKVLKNGT